MVDVSSIRAAVARRAGGLVGGLLLAAAGVWASESATAEPKRAYVGSDFNGDGYADAAVLVGDYSGDDHVLVLFGSAAGLRATARQRIDGPPAENALATGDFDGDGYADLAFADSEAEVGYDYGRGEVRVVYGSPRGLDPNRMQTWNQTSRGMPNPTVATGTFGASLVAGDFGRGAQDDLAIGNIDGDGTTDDGTGTVTVLYGSSSGLRTQSGQRWDPGSPGVRLRGDFLGANFGQSLAAGRFSASGYADLAIGIPGVDVGRRSAGAVLVLRGSADGLTADGRRLWSQNSPGVVGRSQVEDYFGESLAVGQFGRSAYDDLAIGAPGERIAGTSGAGAVNILYGTADGLSSTGNQMRSQRSPGVAGIPEKDDLFGDVLAAADFGGQNSSGYDDLLIGAPQESVRGAYLAGQVHMLVGGRRGVQRTGNRVLAVTGSGSFGQALGAANFRGATGRFADALITAADAGDQTPAPLRFVPGGPAGLRPAEATSWTPGELGVTDLGATDPQAAIIGVTAADRG